MPNFSLKSLERIETLDRRLQAVLYLAIQEIDFIVLEGHRDAQAQEAAFRSGNTKLHWPNGKHNASPSKAVDVAPYFKDTKTIDWKDLIAFGRLMGYIQACGVQLGIPLRFGLDWNGDFHSRNESFLDAPHVELKEIESDQVTRTA